MTIYLAKYVPLVLEGQNAIAQFDIPPYVDASCRREPDLECELPSISALCRGELFAPHLKEGDEVDHCMATHSYEPQKQEQIYHGKNHIFQIPKLGHRKIVV